MRIIHKSGFPDDERYQTRAVIYSNLVVAFKVLLDIMNAEHIDYEHENTRVMMPHPHMPWKTLLIDLSLFFQPFASLLENTAADVDLDDAFADLEVREAMKELWQDAGVQKAIQRGHEFALHDNLQ